MAAPGTVTRLLHAWRQGEHGAADQLMPLVYEELHRLAVAAMRDERAGHTLQPTALVHEAYVRLVDSDIPWQDRAHFLATAATAMRRVLVDHARSRRRLKRGGAKVRVTLNEALHSPDPGTAAIDDVIALDAALNRLAKEAPRRVRVIELRYFGGLNLEESGAVLGLATSTVHRELKLARAWLYRELRPADE